MNDGHAFPRVARSERSLEGFPLLRRGHLIENTHIVGDLLPGLRVGLLQLLRDCLKFSLGARYLALFLEGGFLLLCLLPLGFGISVLLIEVGLI